MQVHGTYRERETLGLRPSPAPRRGTVRGLGISDALLVELQPRQVAACIEEISTIARVLEEALSSGVDDGGERRYELHVLGGMRASLLDQVARDDPMLVGPAPLVSQLVAGATANVVSRLHDAVASLRGSDEASRGELRRRSDDVAAWMTTYLDALTVQWFSFDPDFSPVR